MTESTDTVRAPRRRRLLRVLAWIAAGVIVLLVAAYFVVTSAPFLKRAILPRVSEALNADVTVSDARISPFSSVTLLNLKVQPRGREPLLTAAEVRARYSLMSIVRGDIVVDEVSIISPTVTIVEQPDGTSNLDPLLQKKETEPEKKRDSEEAPRIELKSFVLTNATVRLEKYYASGTNKDVTAVNDLNITLNGLKNGDSGKLGVSGAISIRQNPPAPAAGGSLEGTIAGELAFALSPDLLPQSLRGDTRVSISKAQGTFADLADASVVLTSDIAPTEIIQLALHLRKAGTTLAELRASGPFDLAKTEGKLSIELRPIDQRVLNMATTGSGIQFGSGRISSTNQVEVTDSGKKFSVAGGLDANELQLIQSNQTTPELGLQLHYDVNVDLNASNAVLRSFTLSGTQNGRALVQGNLTSPMPFSWGNVQSEIGDSALQVTLTNLNLADWKALAGDAASGVASLSANLGSKDNGKQLPFDVSAQVADLSAQVGTNRIANATMRLRARGTAVELKQFSIAECGLDLARRNQPALSLSGSGSYDAVQDSTDFTIAIRAWLSELSQLLAQPDLSVSSGAMELNAHLLQQQGAQNVSGSLSVSNLTARLSDSAFSNFQMNADLDLSQTPEQIAIRRFNGVLGANGRPGGSFAVSGMYAPSNGAAQLKANLVNLNQNALRPFLEPALSGGSLASIAVNATITAGYNPAAKSQINADLQVTNLVVTGPGMPVSPSPLEAGLAFDAAVNGTVIDLNQAQLKLTPTDRAKNALDLTGRIDLSDLNAIQGNLKLVADSIDLTRYYDLFASEENTKPEPSPSRSGALPVQSAAPEISANRDLPAQTLPVREGVAQIAMNRVYLREVEITNLQTTLKVTSGRVLLNPFGLVLNGAPVTATADIDVSVPGYRYAVGWDADHIPFAPLVNTFAPSRKGELGGTLSAHGRIQGAGTTGSSLQKSLTGTFDVGTTNLNLSAANVRSPMLKLLVSVVAMVPELARNPAAAGGSLLSGLTGTLTKGLVGGMAGDITNSVIDVVAARGDAGNGVVMLKGATVRSTVFLAESAGTVTLAPVLTNSTIDLPVTIALSRPIAERIKMVPANTPTNAAYVDLPQFFSETGTLGDPKPRINYMALAGGIASQFGVQLPGGSGGGTNSPVGQLIQGIGGLIGNRSATNAPPGNQPAQTNQTPVGNILNQLLGPGRR